MNFERMPEQPEKSQPPLDPKSQERIDAQEEEITSHGGFYDQVVDGIPVSEIKVVASPKEQDEWAKRNGLDPETFAKEGRYFGSLDDGTFEEWKEEHDKMNAILRAEAAQNAEEAQKETDAAQPPQDITEQQSTEEYGDDYKQAA